MSKKAARKTTPAARQRRDHASENAEDYVELISHLTREIGAAHKSDIAERLGVSHVTVHKTINRLKSLGLVTAERYRAVALTDKGQRLADEARERHETVLSFLRDVLKVPKAAAEMDAEGIEHHVGAETLSAMRRMTSRSRKK
jgi:DtxR family manganese transport transcriptional regulator